MTVTWQRAMGDGRIRFRVASHRLPRDFAKRKWYHTHKLTPDAPRFYYKKMVVKGKAPDKKKKTVRGSAKKVQVQRRSSSRR